MAKPSTILVITILWLLIACGLPLYQLREARRQAHQDLLRVVAAGKPDAAGLIAAFERANQKVDAAASGPCLLLAVTSIFLVNQLLRIKGRYDTLAHRFPTAGHEADGLDDPLGE